MCLASPHILPRVETLALHSSWDYREMRDTKHFVIVMSLFSQLRRITLIHVNWALLPQDVRAALSSRAFECISFHCLTGINTSNLFSLTAGSHASRPRATPHRCHRKTRAKAPYVTSQWFINSSASTYHPDILVEVPSFLPPIQPFSGCRFGRGKKVQNALVSCCLAEFTRLR